jgi:hypothetical protein
VQSIGADGRKHSKLCIYFNPCIAGLTIEQMLQAGILTQKEPLNRLGRIPFSQLRHSAGFSPDFPQVDTKLNFDWADPPNNLKPFRHFSLDFVFN